MSSLSCARWWIAGSMLMAGSLWTLAAAADEAEERQKAVSELLETGWEAPIQQLGPTKDLYDAAKEKYSGDPRVDYAFALVQFKHHKFADALDTLRDVLKADPARLGAYRGEIFALLTRNKKSEALARAEAAAEQLAPGGSIDAELAPEMARFLGGVAGFLRGPGKSAVKEATLNAAVKRMTGTMDVSLVEEFEQGHDEVLKKFQDLSQDKDEAVADAKVTQEEDRAREAERLEREKGDVVGKRQQLESQAQQAEADAQRRLSEIDKALAPLNAEFARLDGEARRVAQRIRELDAQANSFFAFADQAKTQFDRDRFILQGNNIAGQANLLRGDYNALDAQARQVNSRRAALNNERQAVSNRLKQDLNDIDRRSGKLDQTERRIAVQEKKNEKPGPATSNKSRTLDKKATSVATYLDFPLDQERLRLEESFRPGAEQEARPAVEE